MFLGLIIGLIVAYLLDVLGFSDIVIKDLSENLLFIAKDSSIYLTCGVIGATIGMLFKE